MKLEHQPPTTNHQPPDYQLKLATDKDITYLTSPVLRKNSIFLAFTTRHSGFSEKPYNSLNLALHVGDNEKKVLKNRRHISKVFGFKLSRLTCAEQVHGNSVRYVNDGEIGAGRTNYSDSLQKADCLVTDKLDVVLGLFFADCLPVVLVSFEPKIVAIAHVGYKGLIKGIIDRSIEKISARVQPKEMMVFLGPSIGACCYRVDESRIKQFSRLFPSIVRSADQTLDLKNIATFQLQKAGVEPENIISSSYCTCCNSDLFFSYRRSKVTGRQAAIAFIKG